LQQGLLQLKKSQLYEAVFQQILYTVIQKVSHRTKCWQEEIKFCFEGLKSIGIDTTEWGTNIWDVAKW